MVSSASRVGSINVLLSVQHGVATQGLLNFAGTVEKTGMRTQRAVGGIDRSVVGMNRTMAGITAHSAGFRGLAISALRTRDSIGQMNNMLLATSALLGGLIPTLSGAYLVKMADRAHLLSNSLRTVTDSTTELKEVQDALFQVAQRTRSSYEATAIIYARTARATEHLKYSQEDLLRITETVQKAFAIGGATSAEARGAAIQLTQGIASDRFSGEEFRSVAENAPVLLRGMAESLGVNIGKLREMAHAGELTAKTVTRAIIEASEEIDREFAQTTSTIGQAVVKLDNAILKYVGDSDKVTASSSAIVTVINAISENLDTVTDSLLLLGTSALAVFGGRTATRIGAWGRDLRDVRAQALAAAEANQALAVAEMKTARSEMVSRRLAFNRALTEGVLSAKQLERQQKGVAASVVAYNAATQRATMATVQLAAAQKAASNSGMAMAVAGRAASAAWAFIGGPFGVALLALGAAWYVYAKRAAEAEAEMRRIDAAADNVISQLAAIERRASAATAEIKRFSEGFADLFRQEGPTRAQAEINDLSDGIGDMETKLLRLAQEMSAARGGLGLMGGQVQSLAVKFVNGEARLDSFVMKMQEAGRLDPDFSKPIASAIDLAEQIDHAREKFAQVRLEMAHLDGMESKVRINVKLMGGAVNPQPEVSKARRALLDRMSEDGGVRQKLIDDLEKQAAQFERDNKGPKRRADDYERTIKRIRESTTAMQAETDVLSQLNPLVEDYGFAVERAKAQHDLLNAAREAGKEITPELAAEIAKEADAYARASAAAEKLKEEQKKILDDLELRKDVVKDVLSGIREAAEDGKVSWQELGDIATRVMDKIINKMEDDLIDSLFRVGQFGSNAGPGIRGGPRMPGGLFGGVLIPGILHDGGDAARPNSFRAIPAVNTNSLPRFHNGVGHNEILAVLEDTETVLTKGQTERTVAALNATMSNIETPPITNEINIHPPAGYAARTQEDDTPTGRRADIWFDELVATNLARPNSRSRAALIGGGRRPLR